MEKLRGCSCIEFVFLAIAVVFFLATLAAAASGNQEIPQFRGINCNSYQLFTCLASKGGQVHEDCCEAIRNVLNPHCLCSPESVSRTTIKSLLPIATTCEVLLDIGEPCGPKSPPTAK